MAQTRIPEVVRSHEQDILSEWMSLQMQSVVTRRDLINESELQRQSRDFLGAFVRALEAGESDTKGPAWAAVNVGLARLVAARALQGFSPSETATFIFSLKQPIFARLRTAVK